MVLLNGGPTFSDACYEILDTTSDISSTETDRENKNWWEKNLGFVLTGVGVMVSFLVGIGIIFLKLFVGKSINKLA